jgi:outer membrane protein assembly factor BamB
VFAFGATGHLSCVDLATGKRLWENDLKNEPTVVIPEWGFSSSPLIVGNLVIVCAGGKAGNSLIGYHMDTGAREWTAGSDSAEYGSPQLADLAGRPQILNFSKSGIFAYAPEDGRTIWSFPWPVQPRKVAQPLVLGSRRIVISSGYGVGSKLLEISPSGERHLSADLIWESNRLKAKFANFVHFDDYIYGLDDGILTCIDVADGKRMWKRGRYGHGQLILVDDKLLISTEKGEIVLVEANPSAFAELCRSRAVDGKTWNTPALAGQYLFVRNSREAACYRLPLKSEETVSLKVTTN